MLWEAEQGRYQIDMLTQTHPEMTVEDAYAVQLENVCLLYTSGGGRLKELDSQWKARGDRLKRASSRLEELTDALIREEES